LAHLELEIAANERRLRAYVPSVRREDLRQLERRFRKMRNCGMRPENAMNPAWDWTHPSRLSFMRNGDR
jgi:hypothetical protein